MELGKIEDYKKIDSMGVYDALSLFPEQIENSWEQAQASDIPLVSCKQVIVSGMGGSSNAAKIIQGLYENELEVPLFVYNDYDLPAWVNQDTLVIANSYSGNTEETLSGINDAVKKGATILGIATGGKIGEMVRSGEIYGVVINPKETNPPNFPKSGLGVSFGGLFGALVKSGVLKINHDDFYASLEELKDIRDSWDSIEISKWLSGGLPVLFAARPFLGSLNAGRNAMCELSRNYTQFYDFPEVNHVLVEATQAPETAKNNKYIFFESNYYNERVKLRFNITKKIFDEQGLQYKTHVLSGKNKITQGLELPYYCAWMGYYISMIDDKDPGPEPWILKLKSELSQPIH